MLFFSPYPHPQLRGFATLCTQTEVYSAKRADVQETHPAHPPLDILAEPVLHSSHPEAAQGGEGLGLHHRILTCAWNPILSVFQQMIWEVCNPPLPPGAKNCSCTKADRGSPHILTKEAIRPLGGQTASVPWATLTHSSPCSSSLLGPVPTPTGSAPPYIPGPSFCSLKEISAHPEPPTLLSKYAHTVASPEPQIPLPCPVCHSPDSFPMCFSSKALTLQFSEDLWAAGTFARHNDGSARKFIPLGRLKSMHGWWSKRTSSLASQETK